MHIRPIRTSDISAVADLQAAAFADDELFTWLYPRRQNYPWTYRHDWLLSIRRRIAQPDLKIFVAELDGDIVGCAVWKRTGEDENAAKWYNDSFSKQTERLLLRVETKYFNFINRALDKKALQDFTTATDYDFYKALAKPGYLHLASLSVSPKHQRKGIGKALVERGMDIAVVEQIPVTLEASMTGQHMYSKLGFVIIEKHEIIESFDGIAMLWEPPALKGRWLESDGSGTATLKKMA